MWKHGNKPLSQYETVKVDEKKKKKTNLSSTCYKNRTKSTLYIQIFFKYVNRNLYIFNYIYTFFLILAKFKSYFLNFIFVFKNQFFGILLHMHVILYLLKFYNFTAKTYNTSIYIQLVYIYLLTNACYFVSFKILQLHN